MPCSIARLAAPSADSAAAYGVLLREPLNPATPAEPQLMTAPLRSVIVMIGLVNVTLGHVLLLPATNLDRALAFRHAWSVPRYFLRRTPTVFFGPRRWRALV